MISKLIAAMKKGTIIPLSKGDVVLYLGASHGVTPEIIAELVGEEGFVFCLDVAPDVVRKLVEVCEKHENMCPLLFDANKPEEYSDKITEVDMIYQDITQKSQVDIFLKNIARFLKRGGFAIIALKTKSIDSVKGKEEVLETVKKELEKGLRIVSITDLDPYHKDHYFIICRKK
ncbi:fibrillarin-like rRNA/tRNA 2'-O-methyltransferase [Candidatus Woesearchaeota archaeon]|nr:fibrillarin-like rRNA/tRNA 2'-O-methyltransferase [Candidatus Woesearchaeota archaeon]